MTISIREGPPVSSPSRAGGATPMMNPMLGAPREAPEGLGDRRTADGDRRQPITHTPGLDTEEQQQREEEHEVGDQACDAAQQPAEHSRQPAEVQRASRLLRLLRADPERRQLRGHAADRSVGGRRVLR
jgi:hypothetical protein